MKFTRFKYYDYFILSFMISFWICGICGMEQHECDAVTSLTAAALAKAINPNFPMKNERSGSSGQNASKEYSNV